MKKPDILILLTIVFIIGVVVTKTITLPEHKEERLMTLENRIR